MATVKISSLPSVTSLNSGDALPTVDIGANPGSPTTYKVTIKNLANSLPQVSSSINALTASYLLASINPFPYVGNAVITGSLVVSGSSGVEFIVVGDTLITGSVILSGSSTVELTVIGDTVITGSLILSGSPGIELTVIGDTQFSGSVNTRGGFTGSLLGTAATGSYTTGSQFVAGNLALSASYAISSSYALSSSYAIASSTSSYLYDLNQNLTITGSLVVSGSPNPEIRVIGDMTVTGSLIVSGNNGAGVFSQGATFVDYVSTITSTGAYMVWRAPFSCSVVGLYGYYTGGTSPQINAARSGSSGYGRITGSNVLLNQDAVWIAATGSGLQNKDFNIGDSLQVIMTGSANYQLAVQVDFIRKF